MTAILAHGRTTNFINETIQSPVERALYFLKPEEISLVCCNILGGMGRTGEREEGTGTVFKRAVQYLFHQKKKQSMPFKSSSNLLIVHINVQRMILLVGICGKKSIINALEYTEELFGSL